MLAPDWSWWDALPTVIAAALLLLGPGGIAASLAGLRPWVAAASAPLLTTSIVAVGGVAASVASVPWTVPTFVGLVLLTWVGAAGVRLLLLGRSRGTSAGGTSAGGASRTGELPGVPAVAGLAVAAVLGGVAFLMASGLPGNLPQNPDMLFHLAVPERFLERQDISSTAATFAVPSASGFYPAALHGLVATLVMLTGVPIVVAGSSLMLVVVALVWPLGVVVLARTMLGPSGLVAWSAAVLALTFTSFPFTVLGWGPLWPFVLGIALVPAWLLLLALASTPRDEEAWWVRVLGHGFPRTLAVVVLVVGLPGLSLAHPNATFIAFILGWMYLVDVTAVHAWRARSSYRSWLPLVAVVVAGVAGAVGATRLAPEAMLAQDWAQKPPFPLVLAVLAVVFLALAAAAARRSPRHWWLVAAVALTLAVALVRMWGGVAATRWVTWPWYNDTQRIRALMVLPVVLAGAAGSRVLAGWLRRRTGLPAGRAAVVVGAALAVLATSQVAGHQQMLGSYYRGAAEGSWVTGPELVALRRLSAVLPDDAVVAANPLKGANFLQVVGPETALIPSVQARRAHPDLERLAASLDTVGEDPELCRIARRWGVTHAIVGGDSFADADATPYAGVERVPDSPAFRLVTKAGPYALYELGDCAVPPAG